MSLKTWATPETQVFSDVDQARIKGGSISSLRSTSSRRKVGTRFEMKLNVHGNFQHSLVHPEASRPVCHPDFPTSRRPSCPI
jgi:hypothetical protein